MAEWHLVPFEPGEITTLEWDSDIWEYLEGTGDLYQAAFTKFGEEWTRLSPRDKWRPGSLSHNLNQLMVSYGYVDRWYSWTRGDGETLFEVMGAVVVRERRKMLESIHSEFLRGRVVELESLLRGELREGMLAKLSGVRMLGLDHLCVSFNVSMTFHGVVVWSQVVSVAELWDGHRERNLTMEGGGYRWSLPGGSEHGSPLDALDASLCGDIEKLERKISELTLRLGSLQRVAP